MLDYISKIPPGTMIRSQQIQAEQNLISLVDVLDYLVKYHE